jgi:hypothetical protein
MWIARSHAVDADGPHKGRASACRPARSCGGTCGLRSAGDRRVVASTSSVGLQLVSGGNGWSAGWPTPLCCAFWSSVQSGCRSGRAHPSGRSAASGGDFGGRAWEAPPRRSRVRPKGVGLIGEPGGTRTHGLKIKSSRSASRRWPDLTLFRTTSGTLAPTPALPPPLLAHDHPSSPSIPPGEERGTKRVVPDVRRAGAVCDVSNVAPYSRGRFRISVARTNHHRSRLTDDACGVGSSPHARGTRCRPA